MTTTIRYKLNEFKRGRTSIIVEKRSDRLFKVTTDETVGKIHNIVVLVDRGLKIKEVGTTVNIRIERVQNVLYEILEYKYKYRRDGCRICSYWNKNDNFAV